MLAPRIYHSAAFAFAAMACAAQHVDSVDAAPAPIATGDPADEPYQVSLRVGHPDASGHVLGGTELINLVAFHDAGGSPRLYAGNGYWTDTQPSSGPQILVLDSPHGAWRQDHAFDEHTPDGKLRFGRLTALAVLTFATDGNGVRLAAPVSLLVAGFERNGAEGSGGIFSRDERGAWTEIPTQSPPELSFRSLRVHRDRVTGIDHVFAGGGKGTGGTPGEILVGAYDPTAPGQIRFASTAEFTGFQNRVMAFEEADGVLCFEAKPMLYARSDGASPQWTAFYRDPRQGLKATNSGGRGLTAVTDPAGSGRAQLLTGFEGEGSTIARIDPTTGVATTELEIAPFLTRTLGALNTPYTISAYNNMPAMTDPDTGASLRLIGLQAHVVAASKHRSGWFLVRSAKDRSYTVHEVPPFGDNQRGLVAVRTIIVSPFPEDRGRVIYLGGFDADYIPSHDSAWLYRVGLRTALR